MTPDILALMGFLAVVGATCSGVAAGWGNDGKPVPAAVFYVCAAAAAAAVSAIIVIVLAVVMS